MDRERRNMVYRFKVGPRENLHLCIKIFACVFGMAIELANIRTHPSDSVFINPLSRVLCTYSPKPSDTLVWLIFPIVRTVVSNTQARISPSECSQSMPVIPYRSIAPRNLGLDWQRILFFVHMYLGLFSRTAFPITGCEVSFMCYERLPGQFERWEVCS